MKKNIISNMLNFWYLPLMAGILHIGLGVWAFLAPFSSFLALTMFLSLGMSIAGLLEIIYALSNRKRLSNWGWYLVGGVLNLIVGISLISNPGISALMLATFIGLWLLFRAIMAAVNAFEIKRQGGNRWGWVLVVGILGILLSITLLWNPMFMGITIGLWMGIGLVTIGVLHVLLSILLRNLKRYQVVQFKEGLDDYIEI